MDIRSYFKPCATQDHKIDAEATLSRDLLHKSKELDSGDQEQEGEVTSKYMDVSQDAGQVEMPVALVIKKPYRLTAGSNNRFARRKVLKAMFCSKVFEEAMDKAGVRWVTRLPAATKLEGKEATTNNKYLHFNMNKVNVNVESYREFNAWIFDCPSLQHKLDFVHVAAYQKASKSELEQPGRALDERFLRAEEHAANVKSEVDQHCCDQQKREAILKKLELLFQTQDNHERLRKVAIEKYW
ncbi:hypothetical protein CYMTET_55123 [Cymbomonas tetramitiformis]|uniref:Uncharacterized protein n=1 Tax=Cymbomonas tetramitiformis TaxID=36881 RepID=A0AAE0BDT5_9CHLO|nr:hypothetical protein CYMTET_55123 [Cymbomonas tetramitiformis]